MLDVTEQLSRYADAVTDTVEAVDTDAIRTTETEARRPRRPSWQPLVAVAAALALLAGVVWFASGSENARDRSSATPGDAIAVLNPGPLSPRTGAATAWTSAGLMVWGGAIEPVNMGLPGPGREFADGAVYHPATDTWTAMAPGPLPADRSGPTALVTEQGVVVTRGVHTALWDPETNTWRSLDDAPAAVEDLVLAGEWVVSVSANAQLDVDSGRWIPLSARPEPLDRPVGIWNGSELVVVERQGLDQAAAVAFSFETRTWRTLPVPVGLNGLALSAARDRERVVFVDYEMHVASWREGDAAWSTLPSVPARFYEYTPTILATPPTLLVTTANALVIRVANHWIPVPRGDLDFWGGSGAVAPADGSDEHATVYAFGVTRAGQNRLIRIDPTALAASARTLQVGEATVHMPAGASLMEAALDRVDIVDTVRVELDIPTGRCTVSSSYVGQTDAPDRWTESDNGHVWKIAGTTSDLVKVTCADPATARDLTTRITVPSRS